MQKLTSTFIAFFIVLLSAFAQDYELIIETSDCDGYVYACVEPFTQEEYIYEWSINGMGIETDTLDNCFEYYLSPGTHIIQVSVYDWNGNSIANTVGPNGDIVPYLTETIYIFDVGFVELYSDAEAYCPGNDNSTGCEKVCENTTIIYTAQSESPGGNDFNEWTVIGAESWVQLSNQQIEVNWGEAGSGQVEVLNISWSNCTAFNFICVEIIESPIADFGTTPDALDGMLSICEGQEVNFLNESTNGVYYEWYFGDGGSSTEANPEHTYNFDGDYEVQLIARNECLCSDTTTLLIHVEPLQSPFISCVGTICELDTFLYSSDADCSQFYWTVSSNGTIVNGGGVSDDYVEVNWTGGPVGNIELSVDNCSGDYCKSPAMIQIPIMSGNAEIRGIDRVCQGAVESYTIQDYSATYYNWTVTGGNILSGQGSNEINVEWNSSAQLPMDALVRVDYENCYLECSGSDDYMVRIVDEYFALGPIEVCPEEIAEYNSLSVFSNLPVMSNWTLRDDQNVILWSFANADLVNIPFPVNPGMYLLEIEAVNVDDYCNASKEILINVVPKTDPPMSIEGEQAICPGGTYQYEVISSNSDFQFNWYVNNGGVTEENSGNTILVTWASTGPYGLSVTQTDFEKLPCESDPISQVINPIPAISLQGNLSACDQDLVEFTTEFIEYASYTWEIIPVDMAVIIGETDKHKLELQWLKSGSAEVKVNMCGQETSLNITIHALPEPTVNHPQELCKNQEAILAVSNIYTDYKWYDEDRVLVSSSSNPTVFPGSYELIVTDAEGCTGNTAFTIETLPLPNIRISSPDDLGICLADGDGYPKLYALDSDYGFTWQWFKDGLPILGEVGSILQADAFANYHVEVTDVKGCKNISNIINVFDWCDEVKGGVCNGGTCNLNYCKNPGGIFDFDYVAGAQCNEIIFTNLSTNTEPGTINWNFGDEAVFNDVSTDFNPSFIYSNAGFYTVLLRGNIADLDNPGSFCSIWRSEIVTVPTVAKFDIDKACPGEAVQFFDLSTFVPGEDITGWSWDFGDLGSSSNTSVVQEPTHIYDNPGSYTVRLEIITASCTSIYEQSIDVYPLPEIEIIEPDVSCAGTSITFTGTTNQYVVDWSWDFGDVTSGDLNVASTQESYHFYDNPGVYTVTLDATNIYGCTEQITDQITISPNPLNGQITSDNDNPMCEGETAVLTSPLGGVSWIWSTGSINNSITVNESDIYSVTVTDTNGCTFVPDSYDQELIPKPTNTIRAVLLDEYGNPVQYIYENLEICDGEELHLEVINQDNQFYVWSSSQLGPEIQYNVDRNVEISVGTHEFIVEITDTDTGCTNVIGPFQVIVHELPQNVSISSSPSGYLCGGDSATISVDNPNTDYTYLWSNGASGTSISTDMAGSYFVSAFNSFGCSQESDKIEIHKGPNVGFIPDGCLERCAPDTLCLPFISGIDSYQWFYNGDIMNGETTGDLIIENSGDYHVELMDVYGCTTTSDAFTVNLLDPLGNVTGLVYFDVDGDGMISPSDTLMQDVKVYLENSANSFLDSLITNVNGEVEWVDVPSTDYDLTLDLSSLPPFVEPYIPVEQVGLVGCDDEDDFVFLCYKNCTTVTASETMEFCAGTHDYEGHTITNDTTIIKNLFTPEGCDSTVTVTVILSPEITSVETMEFCAGTHDYEGYSITNDTTIIKNLITPEGCDSIVTVSVIVNPVITSIESMEFCAGIHDFEGITITNDTTIVKNLITPEGCDSIVTVSVEVYPELELEMVSDSSCWNLNNGQISIDKMEGGKGNVQLFIDDVEYNNAIIPDLSAGTYTVKLVDELNCSIDQTIVVDKIEAIDYTIDIPILACNELSDKITIDLNSPGVRILWEDNTELLSKEVDMDGIYKLIISNQCETIEENVHVTSEIGDDEGLYIPNIFSPNGDGSNDEFYVMMDEVAELEKAQLMIMDRWGEMIYQSDDPTQPWNGMLKGKAIQPGVYVVMFNGTLNYCHTKKDHKVYSEITIVK